MFVLLSLHVSFVESFYLFLFYFFSLLRVVIINQHHSPMLVLAVVVVIVVVIIYICMRHRFFFFFVVESFLSFFHCPYYYRLRLSDSPRLPGPTPLVKPFGPSSGAYSSGTQLIWTFARPCW